MIQRIRFINVCKWYVEISPAYPRTITVIISAKYIYLTLLISTGEMSGVFLQAFCANTPTPLARLPVLT